MKQERENRGELGWVDTVRKKWRKSEAQNMSEEKRKILRKMRKKARLRK